MSNTKNSLSSKTKKNTSGKWISVFAVIIAGLYFVWWANQSEQWNYAVYSIPYFIAGIALIMNKSWSQYIFYFLVIFHIGWLIYTIFIGLWLINILSVKEWNYEEYLELFISLIPGLLFMFVNIGIFVLIYKRFRNV